MKYHTGQGLLYCNFCGKGFNDKTNLLIHIRNHTGERPYVCELCDESFIRKDYLRKHLIVWMDKNGFIVDFRCLSLLSFPAGPPKVENVVSVAGTGTIQVPPLSQSLHLAVNPSRSHQQQTRKCSDRKTATGRREPADRAGAGQGDCH